MRYNDLMIDIETMGNGSDAAMIQLAGVFFDRTSGSTGDAICINICADSCVREGFKEDQSTKDWWATQRQDILEGIRKDAVDIREAMENFNTFIQPAKGLFVWSHATFDFVIVQNYFKKLTENYMDYRGARDIRTLCDLSGIDLTKYDWVKEKTHNALDDCRFQIKYCVDALNMLKGAK